MNTIPNLIKSIFSSKIVIIILVICGVYFILPSGIKDISNWIVSANTHRQLVSEHKKLSKIYEQQKKKIDSLLIESKKNDEKIAEIESKKNTIELRRSKLRQDLKNAKGDIAITDSIANEIL